MNNSNSSYIYLKPEDIRLISFILIIILAILVVILIAMGNTIKSASLLAILGIVTLGVLITIQISIYRHLEEIVDKKYQLSARKRGELYRQTEALFSIFSVLKTELLLPSMGKYTINPDFAKVIIDNILQSKPSVILEMGSGVSTIMAAYALKNLGLGKKESKSTINLVQH